jgi:hypothetical protein
MPICDEMMQFRNRIKRFQIAKDLKYGYFQCIVGVRRWNEFSNEVQTIQQQVDLVYSERMNTSRLK